MSVTMLQAAIQGMEDCKLLQIYGDNKFSTATNGELVFLLSNTRISKYNVIATIDADGNVTLIDRDKADLFVDWSHEHYGNKKPINELPDEQIKSYLRNYLEPDTMCLLQFNNTEFVGQIADIFNRFTPKAKNDIMDALQYMGVHNGTTFTTPFMRLKSLAQFDWAQENKFYFAKFDVNSQRYDICKRTADGGYEIMAKNGSCGTFKKILNDKENRCCIVFNKTDGMSISKLDLKTQVLEDAKGSSYAAANKFVKLEERMTKALNELVSTASNSTISIDLSKIYYPILDEETETIAKIIKRYQKSTNEIEKLDYTNTLVECYASCYDKLQKAQISLKDLHDNINK